MNVPHIRADVRVRSLVSGKLFTSPMGAYLTIKDETAQGKEIIAAIETISDYLIKEVFPLFEKFFN